MCVLYFRSTSLVTLSILYSPFLSLLSHLLRIIVASRNYSFLSSRDYRAWLFFSTFFFLVDEIFRIRVEKFLASFKLITFVETSGSRNFSYIFSPFFFFRIALEFLSRKIRWNVYGGCSLSRRAILGKFFGISLAEGVANLLIYMYRTRLLKAKSLGKSLWNFDRKGFSEIYVNIFDPWKISYRSIFIEESLNSLDSFYPCNLESVFLLSSMNLQKFILRTKNQRLSEEIESWI